MAEHNKSGKSFEQSKLEQEKLETLKLQQIVEAENKNKNQKKIETMKTEITNYVKDNKGNLDILKPFLEKSKEIGYPNPTLVDNIEDAQKIIDLIPKE